MSDMQTVGRMALMGIMAGCFLLTVGLAGAVLGLASLLYQAAVLGGLIHG